MFESSPFRPDDLIPANAEVFRSDAGHFSVDIPAGFVRFNAARLAMVKGRVEKPPKEFVHEGFDRPNAFGGDGSPFILIQEVRERFVAVATHDQVQRALDNEFRKGFDRGGGLIQTPTYGSFDVIHDALDLRKSGNDHVDMIRSQHVNRAAFVAMQPRSSAGEGDEVGERSVH